MTADVRNPCVLPLLIALFLLLACRTGAGQFDGERGAVENITQGRFYATIQAAIDAAADGDEIVAGPITFHETIDLLGKAITLRGLEGPHVTIIDGDGLEGSVVTCANGEGSDTIIEGFTITHGSGVDGLFAGGMRIDGADVTVRNCWIVDNDLVADRMEDELRGGGAYIDDGAPVFEDCVFRGNGIYPDFVRYTIGSRGGAVYVMPGSDVTFTDCSFEGNSATTFYSGSGGAIFARNGTRLTLTRCDFSENACGGCLQEDCDGAGAAVFTSGELVATDCTFTDNRASGVGGALYVEDGTITGCAFTGNRTFANGGALGLSGTVEVTDCSFTANRSSYRGGAIRSHAELTLTDCTFDENTSERGGALQVDGGSTSRVEACLFRNNRALPSIDLPRGGAVMNRDGNVVFNACTFVGNTAGVGGGDAVFNRGVVSGTFTSDDGFESGGELAPGGTAPNGSFGILTLGSTVTQVLTDPFTKDVGTTVVEIGGNEQATEHDVVDFPDAMRIGGVLEIRVVGGFEPGIGDVYTVGSFGLFDEPFDEIVSRVLDGNRYLRVEYAFDEDAMTSGVIRTTVQSLSCPGDLDGDGSTGFADLTLLLGNWGTCPITVPVGCTGDLDLSGSVGPADLGQLVERWGPCTSE